MQNQIDISKLASVDITTVNKEDLVDVSGLTFDTTVPREQRAAQVLCKVKNPYCFRVGDMGVKLEFLDNAPPLQDCFTDFLQRKKAACNNVFRPLVSASGQDLQRLDNIVHPTYIRYNIGVK